MVVNHRLLDRVQAAFRAGEMLDRDQMASIDRCQKPNTSIDGFIDEPSITKPPDKHGASAAIAFGTAFLRSGKTALESQKIQQGLVGRNIAQRHVLAVEDEAYVALIIQRCLPIAQLARIVAATIDTVFLVEKSSEMLNTFNGTLKITWPWGMVA